MPDLVDDHDFRLPEQVIQMFCPGERLIWLQEVAEWLHVVRNGEGISHLVDEAEPASDVCDIPLYREVLYRLQYLRAWFH